MTREEKQKAIDALKISAPVMAVTQEEFSDYIQTLNKVMNWLEQEPVLDKIRAEIIKYEGDCRLSVDEYPSCKQCTDNVFGSIYAILDKYKAESEKE